MEQNLYFTAQGAENGKPIIYRSLHAVPSGERESDFPYLINIYWAFDADANNGLPDAESNEAQIEFENHLESLDKNGISHLMLVVTGNGRKEWVWYVSNIESWLGEFNNLLSERPVYPIEIENDFDPEWNTYHNFVAGVKGI